MASSPPPAPRNVVRPWESVGGAQLASMGVVVDLPPGVPAPPAPRDGAWLVADADTGAVLAAKAAHGHYLPKDALALAIGPTLLHSEGPLILYCGGGISAAANALALTLLGRQDIAIYDGSLQEWAADARLPMTTGAAPA